MRIFEAAIEFAPYGHQGLLGENIGELVRALKLHEDDVTLISPYRGGTKIAGVRLARRLSPLEVRWRGELLRLPVWEGVLPGNVRLLLPEHPLFDEGGVYGDPSMGELELAEKFGLMAASVAAAASGLGPAPDVVHVHDWPMGMVPYYLDKLAPTPPKTVFSLYNLAFQGDYPPEAMALLGIPPEDFTPDDLEFYGRLNFLKAGLVHADAIVAMGRAHLAAILSHERGHRMEGVLRFRQDALIAIPPGMDVNRFDPAKDPHIPKPYDIQSIGGKRVCKRALQDELGLEGRADELLLGLVLDPTDPPLPDDALIAAVDRLTREEGVQVCVLTHHEPPQALADLAREREGALAVSHDGSDAALHRLLAGVDLMAVGREDAPHRRTQATALRYGTLPVIQGTGVLEIGDKDGSLGFEYPNPTVESFVAAVEDARRLYANQKEWRILVLQGMAMDRSWAATGRRFLRLFEKLTSDRGQA